MRLSTAAGGLALLLLAQPTIEASLLLPLAAVSLGSGALATLGLLGAVGLGVALKKSLYYGGRGYNNNHHYHHHDHTGGYGGGHTGGGYGGAHGGGYGGGHTGGGYGGAHTGGGYGGGFGGGYGGGSSYGGGYPSPSYAAPLSAHHRKRRNVPVQELIDTEQMDIDELVSEDQLGCAQRLVCELALLPVEKLEADEAALLALASAKTAKAGMKQMTKAVEAGKANKDCSLVYKNCPFTGHEIMTVVRSVAEDV